jgi:sugar/nucleoside kinase (ribokinase family)
MAPDVLLVGNVTKDLTSEGWRPGGSVLYAAAQCVALGQDVAVVTACEPSLHPEAVVPGALWQIQHWDSTTTFENLYDGGVRRQRLIEAGPLIDISLNRDRSRIVLLMPVFKELQPSVAGEMRAGASFVAASVQGWLRELEGDTVVSLRDAPSFSGLDAVFASEEDLADPRLPASWALTLPIVAVTKGRQGCSVSSNGQRRDIPAVAAREVDSTGAGDVFAAAFSVRFSETDDAFESARFASAAAALSVEGTGIEAVGGRQAIEQRLAREIPARR